MLSFVRHCSLALSLVVASSAFSHDESQYGHIVGKGLELAYKNHALAGSVAETLLFSSPLEGEFGNQIYVRFGEVTLPIAFKKAGSEIKLNAVYKTDDGVEKNLDTKVTAIKDGKIAMVIHGKDYLVTVSSDEMDGNHYVNPTFTVNKSGTTVYSFKLQDGAACIMCATRIATVVLTFLEHAGKL